MDIRSNGNYPSNALSNFAAHPFTIDGIECNSMEGFLQSLKYKNPEMQREICKLIGRAAKKKGYKKNWKEKGLLYWQGMPIERTSKAYQELLDRAYDALSENEGFRRALLATRGMTLSHSIGKNKESDTVLTEREFISRLNRIRERLLSEKE